jgi:hypothetical protein
MLFKRMVLKTGRKGKCGRMNCQFVTAYFSVWWKKAGKPGAFASPRPCFTGKTKPKCGKICGDCGLTVLIST